VVFENLFSQTFDASKLEEDTERVRQAYRDKATITPLSKSQDADSRRGRLNMFTFAPTRASASIF